MLNKNVFLVVLTERGVDPSDPDIQR